MKERLSAICSMFDMPESTASTPGSDAAKRMAHEAGEAAGLASLSRRSTSLGGFASLPPLTGSMITICLSWARATS